MKCQSKYGLYSHLKQQCAYPTNFRPLYSLVLSEKLERLKKELQVEQVLNPCLDKCGG